MGGNMRWIVVMVIVCLVGSAWGQTHTEQIKKELSFELKNVTNTLIVDNVNGHITIEGYSGSAIIVEVEKKIQGKTTARLEEGRQEVQLGVIDLADTLILYVKGLCMDYRRGSEGRKGMEGTTWGYQWNDCKDDEHEYDYQMNFRVRIPASVNIVARTVNEGDITVVNTEAKIKACNVNGGIRLSGVREATYATTINGDVDITYAANPSADCRFYTLNGDINAYFRKGLSSEVSFKSFNGDFYTNLADLNALPARIEKKSSGKGVKYKVDGNRYKTGNGGAHLDFETFNGDVYLREQ